MVTDKESELIIRHAYDYMLALMDNLLVSTITLQLDYHLYEAFKEEFDKNFKTTLLDAAPWEDLAKGDPAFQKEVAELEAQIKAVEGAFQKLERLQHCSA